MREVAVGRDDVDVIRLDVHFVFDLHDAHSGMLAEQFGGQTLVRRIQVLDQHKGHVRIGWHRGEELFERVQPARRCTDADDRKTRLAPSRRLGFGGFRARR